MAISIEKITYDFGGGHSAEFIKKGAAGWETNVRENNKLVKHTPATIATRPSVNAAARLVKFAAAERAGIEFDPNL